MFKGINQYVIPLPDGRWGVCSGSRDMHNPVLCFETMDQAVDYARQSAIQFESEVLILSSEQIAASGYPSACGPMVSEANPLSV